MIVWLYEFRIITCPISNNLDTHVLLLFVSYRVPVDLFQYKTVPVNMSLGFWPIRPKSLVKPSPRRNIWYWFYPSSCLVGPPTNFFFSPTICFFLPKPLEKSVTRLITRACTDYIASPFHTRVLHPLVPKSEAIYTVNALVS